MSPEKDTDYRDYRDFREIKEELKKRELPPLMRFSDQTKVSSPRQWEKRRAQIGEILSRDFAGFPTRLDFRVKNELLRREENSYGGKAVTEYCMLSVRSDFSAAGFPFTLTIPKKKEPSEFFVYLAFTKEPADGICEEIVDAGYAVANVYYQDIAADYFDGHLTGMGSFCTRNPFDSWGKLRIWAWSASRILDVIWDDVRLDSRRAAVMGHSRLGKAALLAGAFDERFALTVSCQSGGGGAALFRGKTGERMKDLCKTGSRLWFDGNFFQYETEEDLPFDQHFLLAMIAPRHLCVTSASNDDWADPKSEFLSCVAASAAYECLGVKGLCCGDRYPAEGEFFHEGNIGYFLRKGTHYLSRDDWKNVCLYREQHHV